MDTNIVPVGEQEMREFFGRVMTSFVSLSKQASELQHLEERFNNLSAQFSQLQGECTTLRKEKDDAYALAASYEAERNDARQHRDDLKSRYEGLTEVQIRTDRRVSELEQQLAQTAHEYQRETDEHRNSKADLALVRDNLHNMTERRNHWREEYEKAAKERDEAKQKLDALEGHFKAIFKVSVPEPQPVTGSVTGRLPEGPAHIEEVDPSVPYPPTQAQEVSAGSGEHGGTVSEERKPDAYSEYRSW